MANRAISSVPQNPLKVLKRMRIRFFERRKTIAPDFDALHGDNPSERELMFDDGTQPDGDPIPGDSVDRGNLSINSFAGIPKVLRPRDK